ncbi:MAG: hypothetical protein JXM70_12520 [Pirellulales bacterium]|nr:hypothetical protein [Pirellulales bacterium]
MIARQVARLWVIVVVALMFNVAQGAEWLVERVDLDGNVYNNIDIECLDPSEVQILYDRHYPGVDLFAVGVAGNWSYSSLVPNQTSAFDLALDPSGNPRMVTTSFPSTTYVLKYWQETSPGLWSYLPLETNVSAGNAKLGIDPAGNSHVAYIDRTTSSLICSTITGDLGGSYSVQDETVAVNPVFDTADPLIRMAMDNTGQPNLLWYESGSEQLKCAHKPTPAGAWQVDTIYNGAIASGFEAAFDLNNNLNVAYVDGGVSGNDYQIRLGVYDGAVWQDEQVDPEAQQVGSLAFDSRGNPHVGYIKYGGEFDEFRHAMLSGGSWRNETVAALASTSDGRERLDMVVDSQNNLHMTFRGDEDELRYARLDAKTQVHTVEIEVPTSLDVEAEWTDSVGFVLADGAWDITTHTSTTSNIDKRAILEFDVGDIFDDSSVISARLEFDVSMYTASGDGGPTPNVFAFEGDGSISPSDASKTTDLAGVSEDILDLGVHSIDLDPTVLEDQLNGGSWLGLVLTVPEQMFSLKSLENPGAMSATLIFEVPAPLIPGDANGDWVVDDADAAILAEHWMMQSGASWSDGDFNNDHKVDIIDASLLASNWNAPSSSTLVSIPEPTLITMLFGGLVMLFVRRRGC